MKRTLTMLLSVAGLLTVEAAVPQVSNVSLAKDARSRKVTISYDLDLPAIVTAEILVDGKTLDCPKVFAGEVNRLVAAGTGKKIYWQGDIDWPLQSAAKLSAKVTAWTLDVPPDYMAVKLFNDDAAETCWYYASTNDIPGGIGDRRYKSDWLLMRRVPAKGIHWRMGNDSTRAIPGPGSQTHLVSFTNDYYIGIYEITVAQYRRIGGKSYGAFFLDYADSDYFPMTSVYYKDDGHLRGNVSPKADVAANSAMQKLRTLTGIKTFDLPTDAQWEFACRAGTATTLNDGTDTAWNGTGVENMKRVAWCTQNSEGHPHEVGLKSPNAWGLYDMLGNVSEWVRDSEHTYTATDDDVDPIWADTSKYWRRGGAYSHDGWDVNSGSRNFAHGGWGNDKNTWTGFRVMCRVGE